MIRIKKYNHFFYSTSFLLFFVVFSGFSFLQEKKYPYDQWTDEIKAKANTAKEVDYLSEEEKRVIYYSNLARMNGKLFAETYLQEAIDAGNVQKSSYTGSLIHDLKKLKSLPPLQPQKDLTDCASDHAVYSGTKGSMGHQNYTKRFKKYASRYVYNGENCDYGNNTGLQIVLSLLIDEDVPDKGHRYNILNTKYNCVGVAIADHKKWDYNCVMDFGVAP